MAKTSYPAPRELGLLESAITAAGDLDSAVDYMAAVDSTGKVVACGRARTSASPSATASRSIASADSQRRGRSPAGRPHVQRT